MERETRSRSGGGRSGAATEASEDVTGRRRSRRSRSRSARSATSNGGDVEMEDDVFQSTETASRRSSRASSRATDASDEPDGGVGQRERSKSQSQSRTTSEGPDGPRRRIGSRTRRKSKSRFSKPTILADDDHARNILQPSINSLLAKLDLLLDGLHRSRVNHFAEASSASASEGATDVEAAVSPKKKTRSRGASKSKKGQSDFRRRQKRQQQDSIVDIDDIDVSSADEKGPAKSETQKRPARAASADSASGSDYAPENDEFNSPSASPDDDIPVSKSRHAKKNRLPAHSGPKNRRSSSTSSNSSGTEPDVRVGLRDWSEVIGMASLTGWSDRVVDRAAKRCAALFGESMAFRTLHEGSALKPAVEPILYTPETILAPDSAGIDGSETSDMANAEARPHWEPGCLICPHVHCWGHSKEFRIPYRVVEHLIRVHGYDPRIPSSDGENEMVGGVHIDGFLQPISAKQGWRGGDKAAVSDKRKKRKRESWQ
ncbi:hypothetical protein AOQ84DRAFT_77075 [Glonium stellatum]|uniref:Rrn9 domain-containing protein n=1 Tax=Glonium stellatum TaxID=574774 RepID=A0A8E2EX79_9PEZI|nr:hypothetical protein AOQ84DRAFT_77075 [Glonium stellatum]